MAFWTFLSIGILLLATAVSLVFKQRVNQRRRRPRGISEALEDISQPIDEIEAYWGSSMAPLPMEAQTTTQQAASESLGLIHRSSLRMNPGEEPIPSPRMLGDDGRRLGIAYFQYLLDNQVLPRGAVSMTNESNIIIAQNALRNKQQSATLSHSAVAQRIGQQALCIFEPLSQAVENVDRAIESLEPLIEDKATFFVLESTEFAPMEYLSHISQICAHYDIPQSHVFIRQNDGTFINYIEDTNDFTPSRIDPAHITSEFFTNLLDYTQDAFDEGDSETVMRTLAPLLAPLMERVHTRGNFPKILLAQALNLTGMTNRALQHEEEAISCFEASYHLLREIEDYEAIKVVEANLGITLALAENPSEAKLNKAIYHLKDVTELNKIDDEAWMYLAHAYLQLYEMTQTVGNLMRAKKAYAEAYALNPSPELHQCLVNLGVQPQAPTHDVSSTSPTYREVLHPHAHPFKEHNSPT